MRTVLILGGSRAGTGQAIVRKYLDSGAAVVATIDPEVSAESVSVCNELSSVKWTELDHGDSAQVESFLASIDSVDSVAVVENYFYMENSEDFDLAKWNRSIAVNLTLLKLVAHRARSWDSCDSITILTSTEGLIGSFGAQAYAATKAGVHNLVKSLANTGPNGMRYNAVAAGWIGGVMDTDEVFNMSRQITPLARLGVPEEVADVMFFLASAAAGFVNGTTVVVDGGYSGVDTIAKYEFSSEFDK